MKSDEKLKLTSKYVLRALKTIGCFLLSEKSRTLGLPGLSSLKMSWLAAVISITLSPMYLNAAFLSLSVSKVSSGMMSTDGIGLGG